MFLSLVQVLVVFVVMRLGEGRSVRGERRHISGFGGGVRAFGGPVRNSGIREMTRFRRDIEGSTSSTGYKGFFFHDDKEKTIQEMKRSAGDVKMVLTSLSIKQKLHGMIQQQKKVIENGNDRRTASPISGFFFHDDDVSPKRKKRDVVQPTPKPESGFFFYPGLKPVVPHNKKHSRRQRARHVMKQVQRGFFFKPEDPPIPIYLS